MNVFEEAVLMIFPTDMVFTSTESSALAICLITMSTHEVYSPFGTIGKEMILPKDNFMCDVPV